MGSNSDHVVIPVCAHVLASLVHARTLFNSVCMLSDLFDLVCNSSIEARAQKVRARLCARFCLHIVFAHVVIGKPRWGPLGWTHWIPHTFHRLSAVARLVAWWVPNLTFLVRAMASSDGGFSAPSTAPTFAADSAASANSGSDVAFAAPAPSQNGTPNGADNSTSDANVSPFDVVYTPVAPGGAGDATGPAAGFAAIEDQVWETGGVTTQERMDVPPSKTPRAA